MHVDRVIRCCTVALLALVLGCGHARVRTAAHEPEGLLLTWQRDPTTTMTVQWLDHGVSLPLVEGMVETTPALDIPDIGPVVLDGTAATWWDRGLAVEFLADDAHRRPPPDELDARLRVGWNAEGLVLAVRVSDSEPYESDDITQLWTADALEIFVSDAVGSRMSYQVVIAPGVDARQPEPRHYFYGILDGPDPAELAVRYVRQTRDGGYAMEVLLPWANLPSIHPRTGTELGFQLYVTDRTADGRMRHLAWYPVLNAPFNPDSRVALRLAGEASPAVLGRGEAVRTDDGDEVRVHAHAELAGQTVSLWTGEQPLGTATLSLRDHTAQAAIPLPAPPPGRRWGNLELRLDAKFMAMVPAPLWGSYAAPAPSQLHYWQAGDEASIAMADMEVIAIEPWTGRFVQRVELTGLEPDTTYRFRGTSHERTYSFRTMPATLDRPLRFAVGGDTRHSQEMMERTSRVAMQYEPEFIVWGGDLAYADGVPENAYRWQEWFDANDNTLITADGHVVPVIVAIGNHEVRGGYYTRHEGYDGSDAFRRDIAPFFYSLFAFPGQPGYAVLDFGDYLSLVILDTDHANPVAGEQTAWLRDVLEQRREVPHVLPVYHVPAYPSHRPFEGSVSARVREHWVPLFEDFDVRLAFEHHDHTYKRTESLRGGVIDETGVVYLGDGAWGVGVRPVHPADTTDYLAVSKSVRHALIMTLIGEEQAMVAVSEHGEVIDTYRSRNRAAR